MRQSEQRCTYLYPRNVGGRLYQFKGSGNETPSPSELPSKFVIFCEGSSIRGMHKIIKAPTPFLRLLWISFVLLMTILLLMTSAFLVIDYLNYHTAWHTSTIIDDKTEFPAITVCSHNPFAVEANRIWKSGKVVPPGQFQAKLWNISLKFIKEGNQLGTFNLYDNAESYYANLDFNMTVKLGHKRDMVRYCMLRFEGYSTVAENCAVEEQTEFHMRLFSHRDFFNCWTIEGKAKETTNTTESIILLISLTPSEDIPEMKETFIMDMLTRGEGVKLVVHQRGTYPDIDKNGINVQPGKMNEIAYETVKWNRHSSPKKICRDNQNPIHDLDRVYTYTFPQCLDSTVQTRIVEMCGCMITLWPRPFSLDDYPYCLNLGPMERIRDIVGRLKCYSKFIKGAKALKEEAQKSTCLPECTFYTYKTTLSVTKWKPSAYKLNRLNKLYRAADKFVGGMKDPKVQQEYADILTQNTTINDYQKNFQDFFDEDRFTYVSLSRQNFDTTLKREKLVLDIFILISRVGGLCSLCIGLTTAFFIELVEFLYLSFQVEKQRRNTKSTLILPPQDAAELVATTGTSTIASVAADNGSDLDQQQQQAFDSPWKRFNNNHDGRYWIYTREVPVSSL